GHFLQGALVVDQAREGGAGIGQKSQRVLGLFAFSHVTYRSRKESWIVRGNAANGQLDGELGAVRPHGVHLNPLVEYKPVSGSAIVGQPSLVLLAQTRWDHKLGNPPTDGSLAAVTEHFLRRWIKFDDPSFCVHRDN